MARFGAVELRRALLLFAIVLGVAAVVAALASPSEDSDRAATTPPTEPSTPPSSPARTPTRVSLDGRRAPVTRTLEIGRATTVVASVEEAGQVAIPDLGLTDAAEPNDPAVFETLPTRRARYRVLFLPSGGVRPRLLGELVSRPAK